MKSIIAIALGLLLLVSAVAATGNSNIANVAVTENMAGQVMTNAYFVQTSDIEANLDGNSINADQITNIEAVDNILTGSKPDGKTFFCQSVDQLINDTGNNNEDIQLEGALDVVNSPLSLNGLIATNNILTNSAANQGIIQSMDVEGNSNFNLQLVGAVTVLDSPLSPNGLISANNILTNSATNQEIIQSQNIEGNSNDDEQLVGGYEVINSPLSSNGFIYSNTPQLAAGMVMKTDLT